MVRSTCAKGRTVTGLSIRQDPRGYVAAAGVTCGAAAARLVCPEGTVARGLFGHVGDIVDGVGLRCGAIGEPSADGPEVWNGGGGTIETSECPSPTRLTGVKAVHAMYFGGEVVLRLRVLCSDAGAPATCNDVLYERPDSPDGEYHLTVAGHRLRIYCRGMQRARTGAISAPKQYLTLPATGPEANFSEYAAGGASPGTTVRTTYSRLRLNPYPASRQPLQLRVRISDQAFSRSAGELCHSTPAPCEASETVTAMPYAVAFGCDPQSSGRANLDLSGTPFGVVDSFTVQGAEAHGEAVRLSSQAVDLTGGGFCGWIAPAPTYNPFNREARRDARHGYDLLIRYLGPNTG